MIVGIVQHRNLHAREGLGRFETALARHPVFRGRSLTNRKFNLILLCHHILLRYRVLDGTLQFRHLIAAVSRIRHHLEIEFYVLYIHKENY